MDDVELDCQTETDVIILHQEAIRGYGSAGSSKRRNLEKERGTFSFLPKGVDQYLVTDRSAEVLYIALDPKFRMQCTEEIAPSVPFDEPQDKEFFRLPKFEQLGSLVIDFLLTDGFGGKLRADALASLVMIDIIQYLENGKNTVPKCKISPRKMKLITSYIDAHSDEQVSLDMLAELAGLSKFHFARMFKLQTGISPHQYVLRHRVRRLQSLLVNNRKNLAELAYEVGFSSQGHMSEAFKKIVGASPSKYRREMGS